MQADEILKDIENTIRVTGKRLGERANGPGPDALMAFARIINSYTKLLMAVNNRRIAQKAAKEDPLMNGDPDFYEQMSKS